MAGASTSESDWSQGAWIRPRGGDVHETRFLFIGNVGPSSGVSVETLRTHLKSEFREFLAVVEPSTTAKRRTKSDKRRTKSKKDPSHVFAAFETADAAARAKAKFESEGIDGNRLVLDYADYCSPKAKSEGENGSEERVALEADDLGIQGLCLFKDFITVEEEKVLLSELEVHGEWKHLARRRVKHFGFEFDYTIRGVHPDQEILAFPPCVTSLTERISKLDQVTNEAFDQLTVNEYLAGVGLSPHVDTHSAFAGDILSLSLGSTAIMEFRRGEDHRKIFLPRRALIAMTGESRLAWQHYIPHRKTDRVGAEVIKRGTRTSITFRTVRKEGGCACAYPDQCDSQASALPPTRMLEKLQKQQTDAAASLVERAQKFPDMEKSHVHEVYDSIAGHFSATRFAIWPEVKRFLDLMPPHSLVGDIGCGNGKYFDAGKHCCMVGGDLSLELVALCKNRGHKVVQLDVVRPPFRQGIFDGVISIAVVHHLSSFERRVAALTAIVNMLRPGGLALVTVWAKEQEEAKKMKKWKELDHRDKNGAEGIPVLGKDYLVPWNVPFHRPEAARNAAKEAGVIDEKKGTIVFQRFYHVFEKGELEYLVNYIPHASVERCVFDRSNWCITVRRDE